MGFGLEVELARRPRAPNLDVARLILPYRYRLVRQVRDGTENVGKRTVERLDVVLQRFYLLPDLAALPNGVLGVATLALRLRHLNTQGVALRFEVLDLGHSGTALVINLMETLERLLFIPRGEPPFYLVKISAQVVEIQHEFPSVTRRQSPPLLGDSRRPILPSPAAV